MNIKIVTFRIFNCDADLKGETVMKNENFILF